MNWIKTVLNKILQNSSNTTKQKQFGYLISGILCCVLGWSIYKNGFIWDIKQIVLSSLILLNLGVTLILPKVFFPILYVWFIIGEVLGQISSFVILGILYYLIFSPITILMRIFNKKTIYRAGWIDKKEDIDYESP